MRKISFRCRSIPYALDSEAARYDYAVALANSFSLLPGRNNRNEFLIKIRRSLKDNGILILAALLRKTSESKFQYLRKILPYLTWGNFDSSEGDVFEDRFFCAFRSIEEVQAEVEGAAFSVIESRVKEYPGDFSEIHLVLKRK